MPRAHRHFIPGHIWHITHRCHDREFLLDRPSDRQSWLSWLQKAQLRHKFLVLDYSVTSNHIHLLLQDPGAPNAIAQGMQFVQGRMAQEYNERNGRLNAFWGDRYHATAVESGFHLLRCLVYIDLNMVRAGVVAHPGDWPECGYGEIQSQHTRSGIIDKRRLAALLGCPDLESLRRRHLESIHSGLETDALKRDGRWSESVAMGSQTFVEKFAHDLGIRLGRRKITAGNDEESFTLREPTFSDYGDGSIAALSGNNSFEWVQCGIPLDK
jgi:putative transposase